MRGGGFGGPGRDFSNRDLYADYSGPDQQGPGMRIDGYGGGGGYNAGLGGGFHGAGHGAGAGFTEPEPSQQIMVRNVSARCCVHTKILSSYVYAAALVHCK